MSKGRENVEKLKNLVTTFEELTDKDSTPQDFLDIPSASGALVVNTDSYSCINITLTGNVTSVSITGDPGAAKQVPVILNVYQGGAGGHGMNWTGSGVHAKEGDTATDYDPLQVAGDLTQYWLFWTGSIWTISIVKVSNVSL